jgi:hypothetical protein
LMCSLLVTISRCRPVWVLLLRCVNLRKPSPTFQPTSVRRGLTVDMVGMCGEKNEDCPLRGVSVPISVPTVEGKSEKGRNIGALGQIPRPPRPLFAQPRGGRTGNCRPSIWITAGYEALNAVRRRSTSLEEEQIREGERYWVSELRITCALGRSSSRKNASNRNRIEGFDRRS